MDRSESLAAARWGAGLADVLLACPTATAAEEISLLRRGYVAIRDAAALDPACLGGLPSSGRFEAFLVCGAPESAAIALIPSSAGYMVSRGGNGRHIASVFMAESGEHTIEGNTAAIAIMGAAISSCRTLLHLRAAPGGLLN